MADSVYRSNGAILRTEADVGDSLGAERLIAKRSVSKPVGGSRNLAAVASGGTIPPDFDGIEINLRGSLEGAASSNQAQMSRTFAKFALNKSMKSQGRNIGRSNYAT